MIPRNKLAKAHNNRIKNAVSRQQNIDEKTLDNVCEKHSVKSIDFRSCKMADEYGKVTHLEHTNVLVNMKASVMIIKYTEELVQKDGIYDLLQLAYEKRIRDEKKKIEEEDRVMRNNGQEGIIKQMEDEYARQNSEKEKIIEEEVVAVEEVVVEEEEVEVVEEEVVITDENRIEKKRKDRNKKKRDKIIENAKKELEKKSDDKPRNKYNRNFISELKDKFRGKLTLMPEYKFVEVRKINADLVIENSQVYKLNISSPEKYLLIIGDLNMKKEVAKKIDPGFESEKILNEYGDFVERLKSKNTTAVVEYKEDLELDQAPQLIDDIN